MLQPGFVLFSTEVQCSGACLWSIAAARCPVHTVLLQGPSVVKQVWGSQPGLWEFQCRLMSMGMSLGSPSRVTAVVQTVLCSISKSGCLPWALSLTPIPPCGQGFTTTVPPQLYHQNFTVCSETNPLTITGQNEAQLIQFWVRKHE